MSDASTARDWSFLLPDEADELVVLPKAFTEAHAGAAAQLRRRLRSAGGTAAEQRFLQCPRRHLVAEFAAQAFFQAQPRVVDGVFHVRQALFHDAEHVQVGGAELLGHALTAGIVLGAIAFAVAIKLLLLIESPDDFLQAAFHFLATVLVWRRSSTTVVGNRRIVGAFDCASTVAGSDIASTRQARARARRITVIFLGVAELAKHSYCHLHSGGFIGWI